MTIDDTTIRNLRERLNRERLSVQNDIDQITEDIRSLAQDDAEEGGVPTNHMADNGSAVYERERLLTVQNELGDRLELVEAALTRMDDGTYGACDRCGNEIAIDRLSALPFARYCIACQEIVEDELHVNGMAESMAR